MSDKRFTGASGAEYEMAAKPVPYPTPTRLQLVRDIKAGHVRFYPFSSPWFCRTYDDRNVSVRVQLLIQAGLVDRGEPQEHNYSIVSLTPAGEEWLTKYGSTE